MVALVLESNATLAIGLQFGHLAGVVTNPALPELVSVVALALEFIALACTDG